MKSLALFTIVCLFASGLAQIDLSMIERTDFGQMLMEAVELRLDTADPVAVLQKMLGDMAKDLADKQKKSDKAHASYQASCKKDIAFYQGEIAAAVSAIEGSTKALAALRPQLARAQKDLVKAKATLASLQSQLVAAHKQRKVEAKEYAKKVEEHRIASAAILKAKGLFESLRANKASFLETNAMTELSSSLRSTVEQLNDSSFKSIFRLMAQVSDRAPQADQAIVNKIISLCDKVMSNIEASAAQEKAAEDARIAAYKTLVSKLEGEISSTKGHINRLTNEIENTKNAIQSHEQIIADNKDKKQKNEHALSTRTTQCNNETMQYTAEKKKRNSERQTVSDVIDIVNTKLATLKNYIKKRVAHVA